MPGNGGAVVVRCRGARGTYDFDSAIVALRARGRRRCSALIEIPLVAALMAKGDIVAVSRREMVRGPGGGCRRHGGGAVGSCTDALAERVLIVDW